LEMEFTLAGICGVPLVGHVLKGSHLEMDGHINGRRTGESRVGVRSTRARRISLPMSG
jgi:hypothetical protein